MKTAFTTSGETLDGPLEPRFGRAPRFLVYDDETREFELVDNQQNMNAPQGAGIQAAQSVADKGVRRLVTGHCGPKAFRVLSEADIEVYNTELPTVAAALEALEAGRLKPLNGPDVEGHWS